MKRLFKTITIAGSDSGGGAGVQADIKTFQAFDVYGMSAITAITSQNTTGVSSVMNVSPNVIYDQIAMVSKDIGIDACKIGMLANTEVIDAVFKALVDFKIQNIVLDPVMVAKSGDYLLRRGDENSLVKKLLPLCFLVTPNIPEAELISQTSIKTKEDMINSILEIKSLGPKNVLLKGGHMQGDFLTDILYDGIDFYEFTSKKVNSKNTHGTGCTLSAAITASLARGNSLYEAVKIAKKYTLEAIKKAPTNIGQGHGPLYHNLNFSKVN
ncbi:bifunctional hydroxymethylpyrimidine kinase/phosphomethylpyrimidine kinase [Proteinivorax tanatarense]|uniref:Hydroxymethylpyrimidine/phosphomethylpyrimidine kinase n=1 Tax=Proteinivorax tanatarense TaxID=1260629 RepID=A0AAU7VJ41_9FIRM